MVGDNILTVEKQGRHKYFRLFDKQVASVLESIAFLSSKKDRKKTVITNNATVKGIKFARSCYDHLAGYLGVAIQDNFIKHGLILLEENDYTCSEKGIKKFKDLGIEVQQLNKLKRKFAYPCLDWSERRHHIGGALGASLFQHMILNDWLRKKRDTRELLLTSKGLKELENNFRLRIR